MLSGETNIDAYLDESGIHDGAPATIVAGYFGHRDQWDAFTPHWERVLDDFSVPLAEFHTKDLINRAHFFKTWDYGRSSRFLTALATVILRYEIFPVSVTVLNDDFHSLPQELRKFLTGALITKGEIHLTGNPNKPYFMALQDCLRTVMSHIMPGYKVNFLFGVNRPFAGYASELIERLRNRPTNRLWGSAWRRRVPVS